MWILVWIKIGVGVFAFNSQAFYSSPILPIGSDNFNPNFYLYIDPTNLVPVMLPPCITNEARTECSETLAHKIQIPGIHPKERLQSYIFTWTLLSGIAIVFKWDEFRVSCTVLWFAIRSLEWGVLASAYLPQSPSCHGQTHCDKVMSVCNM